MEEEYGELKYYQCDDCVHSVVGEDDSVSVLVDATLVLDRGWS